MKFLMYALVFVFSVQAQSNERIKNRIRTLMNNIDVELDYTRATDRELREARKSVKKALNIIRGEGSGDDDVMYSYICVSRDDDGANPYSLAVRNESDFSTKKLTGVIFGTKVECENSIRRKRRFTNQYQELICASRDADGRNPVSTFYLNGERAMKLNLVYDSMASCYKALRDTREKRAAFGVCASRDADGHNPWALFSFHFSSNKLTKNSESYGSYESCKGSLR